MTFNHKILDLIKSLNLFINNAERVINQAVNDNALQKKKVEDAFNSAVQKLRFDLQSKRDNLQASGNRLIKDAENILANIRFLEDKLMLLDRHYCTTKVKKEHELKGRKAASFMGEEDAFSALKAIREQFEVLSAKYSRTPPSKLLDTLNYHLSSARKKDYEQLIVLQNTTVVLLDEIRSGVPELTLESVSQLDASYHSELASLKASHLAAQDRISKAYEQDSLLVAEALSTRLDTILPDVLVQQYAVMARKYLRKTSAVNTASRPDDGLVLGFLNYPFQANIRSKALKELLAQKCAALLQRDGTLAIPLYMSPKENFNLLVSVDAACAAEKLAFAHAVMMEHLKGWPVGHVLFTVVDPESRGNSISPFFDLKKRLPEIFYKKTLVEADDIYHRLEEMSAFVDSTIQTLLTNQYDTLHAYQAKHPDYDLQTQLLLIFDFPKAFNEASTALLRNLLRNGHRCCVHVLMVETAEEDPAARHINQTGARQARDLCALFKQSADSLMFSGLRFTYEQLPGKQELAEFFSKYHLSYESSKNKGIALPSMIRGLLEADDSASIQQQVTAIQDHMASYQTQRNQVPPPAMEFPASVTLGTMDYPMDLFTDKKAYKTLQKSFCVSAPGLVDLSVARLPFLCDLDRPFNLYLPATPQTHEQILAFTHHVMWRFFATLPVSKLNVIIMDGERCGNSVTPFLDFINKVPEVFDQEIHINQEDMYDQLRKLDETISSFIRNKLGNRYANIIEYNRHFSKRQEAVTLLVIYDFPTGFDARNLELLLRILKNGSKCGIYTLLTHQTALAFPGYDRTEERLEELKSHFAEIACRNNGMVLLPYNLPVSAGFEMTDDEIDDFSRKYLQAHRSIMKQGVPFEHILSPQHFAETSQDKLTLPMGLGDAESVVSLSLGEGSSHHGLIVGATGSGKSTLLHTLILSGMLQYSPSQLHLYLMDFKSGTEFKVYESERLPHIQLLALDAMQEFGESILEELVRIMEQRSSLFREAGQPNLSGYVRATGRPMARILVIIDEFQVLFNDAFNRKVAQHCAVLTQRIVTEGRSFGIHLLMATQTTRSLMNLTLSHGTIEQMRVRFALKSGEDDARYLFGDRNDSLALDLMRGPIGTTVMNPEYTESNIIAFQTARCDDDAKQKYLALIAREFQSAPYHLRIFEGSRVTQVLDFFQSQGLGLTSKSPATIHLGSLIKVGPPFSLVVDYRKKHNLLICGTDAAMAGNLTNLYLLSVLLYRNSTVYCVDGEILLGESVNQEYNQVFSSFTDRFHLAGNRGDIIRFINSIYDLYLQRKRQPSDRQVFLVIRNLQYIDILRKMFADERVDAGEYEPAPAFGLPEAATVDSALDLLASLDLSGSELSVTEKLLKLVDDGPAYGFNTVVSSTEFRVIQESMQYGSQILPKFPERIIFSLNDHDSDSLIDGVSTSSLQNGIVYFSDGAGNTFQFKPYIMPDPEALKTFLNSQAGER